jgi:hypothetical protein
MPSGGGFRLCRRTSALCSVGARQETCATRTYSRPCRLARVGMPRDRSKKNRRPRYATRTLRIAGERCVVRSCRSTSTTRVIPRTPRPSWTRSRPGWLYVTAHRRGQAATAEDGAVFIHVPGECSPAGVQRSLRPVDADHDPPALLRSTAEASGCEDDRPVLAIGSLWVRGRREGHSALGDCYERARDRRREYRRS